MGPDETQAPEQGEEKPDLGRMVNAAVSSHMKRLQASMAKDFESMLARALEARSPAPAPEPASEPAAKPVRDKAAEDRIAALERRLQEADARAKAAEDKARLDKTRGEVKSLLESKGVTGARARAVLADFEASGALRYGDDGEPYLAIKRSRAKGAPVEEGVFDLASGIEDWAQSGEAREFLPPPETVRKAALGRPGQRPAPPVPPTYDPKKGVQSAAKAVQNTFQTLEAQGIDEARFMAALLNGG